LDHPPTIAGGDQVAPRLFARPADRHDTRDAAFRPPSRPPVAMLFDRSVGVIPTPTWSGPGSATAPMTDDAPAAGTEIAGDLGGSNGAAAGTGPVDLDPALLPDPWAGTGETLAGRSGDVLLRERPIDPLPPPAPATPTPGIPEPAALAPLLTGALLLRRRRPRRCR
jgi:hypothetical protein